MRTIASILVLTAMALGTSSVMAAPRPEPGCTLADGHLSAWNLPDDPINVTPTLYPVGGGQLYPDGVMERDWHHPEAFVWTRGGGKSLFKAGKQLNDYHVIAYCEDPA